MMWYVVNKLITDNYQEALKWANEVANETQKIEHEKKQTSFQQDSKQNTSQEQPATPDARRHQAVV